jgi:N6-adenosine-specific RNA methylase IME4
VTNPRLFADKAGHGPTPAEMMARWGFVYVTVLTWHKLGAPGMGWYFRGDTEHVLFGVKGKLGIPASERVSNHFAAAKSRHSAKPDRFYEIVERVSPEPRLELFARRRRFGWDVWGNEAPEHAASQAVLDLEGIA